MISTFASKMLCPTTNDSGIIAFFKDLQKTKAFVPISVTDLGIFISSKDEQPLKQPFGILVKDEGNSISFNAVHFSRA